ncbi:MAG: hypothetical protein HY543_10930 [Deltaproteobacteria bacterium]|nr:hypothetical protein [Deltaproteobacteria bacterium]
MPHLSTIVSVHLKWLERYLHRAKKHMPSLILPRRIRSHLPTLRREQRTLGTCDVESRTITLATHRVITIQGKKRKKRKHVALSQREILMTLAHEIAHLRYGLHDYEQEAFARTIFNAFGVKERCPQCKGSGMVPARYVN